MRASLLVAAAAITFQAAAATAQNTATQSVGFRIEPINAITVSGSPTLVASPAGATVRPGTVATSAVQSWSVTTTESNVSVTARIDSPMPPGVELKAGLAAPSGASSTGYQTLSTTPVTLVSGISQQNAAALALSYQLDASQAPNVAAAGTRTVTFALTTVANR